MHLCHVGSAYGGGWVADSLLHGHDLVYSIGVGEDISFDLELSKLASCRIVGIDPTPRAAAYVAAATGLPKGYTFVPVGLAAASGSRRFYFPANPAHVSMSLVHDSGAGHIDCEFLTLSDLMARLGHTYVDLLKLDIEGEEYAILADWLARSAALPVGQLWIEFHPSRAATTPEATLALVQQVKTLGFIPLHNGQNGYLMLNTRCVAVSARARWHLCTRAELIPV